MRSWQALSALVLLFDSPRRAAAEAVAEPAALSIPKEAPTGPSDVRCGTGKLSAAEYEEWWGYWRAIALWAEDETQRECRGLALTQLAQLTDNQGLSQIGAPYWRAALVALESVLAESDPRLASVRLRLAAARGTPAEEKERLIRASLLDLEAALVSSQEVPALGCAFLLEASDPRVFTFPADLRAGTPAERRELLSDAQLAQLTLLVEGKRIDEALAAVGATRRHLERRLALDGAGDRARAVTHAASRLVHLLERMPPARVPPKALVEAVDLLRKAAGDVLYQGQGLRALAAYHLSRRELDSAEEALLIALRLNNEAARGDRGGAGGPPLFGPTRSLVIYDLADIYELQHRWSELERLHLEEVAAAEKVSQKALGESLQRLVYFYTARRRHEEAVTHLRRLERYKPESWHIHQQLGGAFYELGRWGEAEAELLASLELLRPQVEPDNTNLVSPLLLLGRLHRQEGRVAAADAAVAEAAAVYDAALEKEDRHGTQWVVLGGKAGLLVEAGRLDEAEALYRQVEAALGSKVGGHGANMTMPLLGRMRVAAARGDVKQATALLEDAAQACSAGYEAGSAGLERCLSQAAELAAEAGLEGCAADLVRRAEQVTAWARRLEVDTGAAARPTASRGALP